MLSAGGVWGQAGGRGRGGRGGHRQRRCEGAGQVTTEKREGPADQEAELPSAAGCGALGAASHASHQDCLLQVFLSRVWWGASSLSPPFS